MIGLYLRSLMAFLVIGIASVLPVFAQDMSMDELLTAIDLRLQNITAKQDAIQAGRERAVLCQSCHGKDGNSTKPDVPNLAGQNAGYLLDQINRFADGRREDFVMNQLAENFSTEDKINVAIYYYSMPVKPRQVNWHLANKGENLYKYRCSTCHGEQGLGHKNLARLAGQQPEYVKNALNTFRNSAIRRSSTSSSQRTNTTMERIARNLTNEQIEQLAEFVAQLSSGNFE